MQMLYKLNKYLSNIPGKRFNEKFIIFESDDWGAIRMSSKMALEKLLEFGIKPIDNDEARYLYNDMLESVSDLHSLFDLITCFKDGNGRHPVFTGFCLSANPDFDKIKSSNYSQYFFENVSATYKRYYPGDNHQLIFKNAINEGLFSPEFHGREHLNVPNWMNALQSRNEETIVAFENGVYGFTPIAKVSNVSYQAAFDVWKPSELEDQGMILTQGIDCFEDFFGKYPEVFVAPNGPYNLKLNEVLSRRSIKYIGISKNHKSPTGFGRFKRSFHYIGQKNQFNQVYLTRNCTFEPSIDGQSFDWVDRTLFDINVAFKNKKPAVISTHRVNYMGGINISNRDNGLRKLELLLKGIIKKWPDVQFLSSSELGKLICN